MELAGSLALTVGLGLGGSRFFKWLRVTCTTNSERKRRGRKEGKRSGEGGQGQLTAVLLDAIGAADVVFADTGNGR